MFVSLFCTFCFRFCVFCVLFLLVCLVVSFLFMYMFTDHCHRVETQLQLINIISYHISHIKRTPYVETTSACPPVWLWPTVSEYLQLSIEVLHEKLSNKREFRENQPRNSVALLKALNTVLPATLRTSWPMWVTFGTENINVKKARSSAFSKNRCCGRRTLHNGINNCLPCFLHSVSGFDKIRFGRHAWHPTELLRVRRNSTQRRIHIPQEPKLTSIHTFCIYCPILLTFGRADLKVILLNGAEFTGNRLREGILYLWA